MVKRKGWTTTKLMVTGSIGVLRFLIWIPFTLFFPGSFNPIPIILSFFFFSFISVLSLFVVRQFGTVTLQTTIEYILELPLPNIVFKPIAFFTAIIRSFIVDALFIFFNKKEKLIAIICGGANSFLNAVMTYYLYTLMNIPGADKIPSILFTPFWVSLILGIILIEGVLGGYFGYITYRRIRNTSVIKRIQL